MFLKLIDAFTPWHLKLIFYFDDPNKRFKEQNLLKPNICVGGLTHGLYEFYPELASKDDLVRVIFNELYTNKIVNTKDLGGTMSSDGIFSSRLTGYGKRFLSFIQIEVR